jgi:hypothetical protein
MTTTNTFKDIDRLEADLWEAADNLRANSKLTSSDYFMPVLGVIFLRHAANRFDAAHRQIEADRASGKMPKRKVLPADYIARRSLYLPERARDDWIMQQATVSGAHGPGRSRKGARTSCRGALARSASRAGVAKPRGTEVVGIGRCKPQRLPGPRPALGWLPGPASAPLDRDGYGSRRKPSEVGRTREAHKPP